MSNCPYKSLVFFDLESTDLPNFRPAITELSFVAVSTDHFENLGAGTGQLPRVLQKLTLCVNPVRKIHPEAALLSGLDNFLLEHESKLDRKTLRMISAFLDQLQQPVCLIAHNGNSFDFPLLAKYYSNDCHLMQPIKCVDSLPIFRKIDEEADKLTAFLNSELEEIRNAEDGDTEQSLANTSTASTFSVSERAPSPDLFMDLVDDDFDETLTQLTEKAEALYSSQSTPDNKGTRNDAPPKLERKPPGRQINRQFLQPRQLFYRKSYKLTTIHERCYGYIPEVAHRAEEDALILLKCARFKASDFSSHLSKFARDLQSYIK